MLDAERLMHSFATPLRESPFRIAPERIQELIGKMGGDPWPLNIVGGAANFTAYPAKKEIKGTYAAMLSLWAVSASVQAMIDLTQTAAASGDPKIIIEQGGPGSEIIEFKLLAEALIRNEASPWVNAPADPNVFADLKSPDGLVTNLFLAAASVIVLHEYAHIALRHQPTTTRLHEQEFEADLWAVAWVLDKVQNEQEREFRTLAVCTALIWVGLIDGVRQANSTHPSAASRLGKAFENFGGLRDQSQALEIGSYVLKAFFDPTTDLHQPESAMDSFRDRLIDYLRSR